MMETQFTPILVMDQYLETVAPSISTTMLLRIPTHRQEILAPPTNLHLASTTAAPSWQVLPAFHLLKWKCFILCRTDLHIFTAINIVIFNADPNFCTSHYPVYFLQMYFYILLVVRSNHPSLSRPISLKLKLASWFDLRNEQS